MLDGNADLVFPAQGMELNYQFVSVHDVKSGPNFRHCSDGVGDWAAQAAPHLESRVGDRGEFGLPAVEEALADDFSFV